jgi:alpha-tubulin suppressor-like RCC1 family protein
MKTDGTLWALGGSLAILVGNEAANTNGHPRRISDDTDWKFVPSNNHDNSVAMKMDGSLWAWGTLNSNEYDEWGEPLPLVEFNRRSITRILSKNNWATVSANSKNILTIASDGTLWAWGSGPLGMAQQLTI